MVAQTMPSASSVDLTNAISVGLSSRCRMFSGDFIFTLFLSVRNGFTTGNRNFLSPCLWWWFIDRRPKNTEFFYRLHELGKIHRLHHIGIDAVLVKFNQ